MFVFPVCWSLCTFFLFCYVTLLCSFPSHKSQQQQKDNVSGTTLCPGSGMDWLFFFAIYFSSSTFASPSFPGFPALPAGTRTHTHTRTYSPSTCRIDVLFVIRLSDCVSYFSGHPDKTLPLQLANRGKPWEVVEAGWSFFPSEKAGCGEDHAEWRDIISQTSPIANSNGVNGYKYTLALLFGNNCISSKKH